MSKEGSEGLRGTIGGRGTKIKSKGDLKKHPSPKGTEAVPGGQLEPFFRKVTLWPPLLACIGAKVRITFFPLQSLHSSP